MNNPKKHHFVPKVILRNFSEKAIYMYNKENNTVYETNIDNAFSERYLYATSDVKGIKEFSIEKKFSKLESSAKSVLVKIIKFSKNQKYINITDNELDTLEDFYVLQYKRTPNFLDSVLSDDVKAEVFNSVISRYEKKYGEPLSNKQIAYITEKKESLLKDSQVLALDKKDRFIKNLFSVNNWRILLNNNESNPFLIGSYSVARFKGISGRSELSEIGVRAWLPISPSICISIIGLDEQKEKFRVETVNDQMVDLINQKIYEKSSIIGSNKIDAIRKYTNQGTIFNIKIDISY